MQNNLREKRRPRPRNTTNLEKQKRMRKFRVIKIILKILICMALLIGLIAYGLTSPMFNITEINVIGNEKFDSEEYLALSNLKIGDNIFNFSKSKVISNIKNNNSYVESITIKRKLPSKIEIIIEERTATYAIYLSENQVAYINNQGYILEKSSEKSSLTLITGLSTQLEDIKEGNRLENEDLEKLQNVIQIKGAMNNIEINRELSAINVESKSNYILTLEKEAKEVYLGGMNDLSSKMLYMKYVLEEQEGVPGTIYLNQEQIYFSPK